MNALEELTADIRQKLPRLIYDDYIVDTDPQTGFSIKYELKIPEDPMLNDVLEWLDKMTEDMSNINSEGVIYFTNFWNNASNEVANWDLSKPFLKDQSPELISFLHGLIKNVVF